MTRHISWLVVLWLLAGCSWSVDGESEPLAAGSTCVAIEDEAMLRERFLATLFPKSAEDTPFACGLGGDACQPELFHLEGPLGWSGEAPAVHQCRSATTQTLVRRCDRYAKHLLSQGLDEGSLTTLLEGVTRLRDVMEVVERRAPGMSHYRLDSSDNLFAEWLRKDGVEPEALGACVAGSADARNRCLGGPLSPGPAVVRGLLQILDQHNGVLARHGAVEGAAARQLAIFSSATGPQNAILADTQKWTPRATGTFLPQTLAKVFSLRVLDGSAGAIAGLTELDAYRAMQGYQPESTLDIFSVELGMISAQVAAYGWDERIEAPRRLNHQAADDLHTFFATLRMTALTAQGLGQCGVRNQLAELYRHVAATNLLPKLDMELREFGPLCLDSSIGRLLDLLEGRLEACGFRSYDQQLVSYTVSESREETVSFDESSDCVVGAQHEGGEILECETFCYTVYEQNDCIPDEIGPMPSDSDCIVGMVPAGEECTTVGTVYWEAVEAEAWVEYGEEVVQVGGETYDIDEVLETTMIVGSVRRSYRELLSSMDPEVYDHTGDGIPDLNYDIEADDATILRAGVGTDECLAELEGSSLGYAAAEVHTISCPTDEGDVDASCVLTNLGLDEHEFIPYAVAVRICPEYVADITGVDTANAGSFLLSCATPWSFTNAVHTFLATDFIADTAALNGAAGSQPWSPEAGETEQTTLMDFAQEAIALSQPVSAMYRHRADFASVAGEVPGAASASGTAWSYDDHIGLHHVDHWLTLGEDMMGRGLALVGDFDSVVLDGEPGSDIIAELARDALSACQGPGCGDNGTLHARATFWRRVRDAIESYDRLGGGRLEMQWRRLDGDICHDDDLDGTYDRCLSCFVGVDEDGDGLDDSLSCDSDGDLDDDGVVDVENCEAQCGYYDDAIQVVDESEERLGEVATMLEAQRQAVPLSDINQADLDEFLSGAERYARGASTQRGLELDALESGRDWLGYKQGLWYPGIDIDLSEGIDDASDHVAAKVAELEAAAADAQFDTYISSYLNRVAALDGFHDDVDRQLASASVDVASYCSGGVDACVTEWSDDWAMVDAINGYLVDYVCARTIELQYYDAALETNATATRNVGIPLDECPVFVSPDLVTLGSYTGSIPLQGAALEAALAKVEVAIADIDAYIATIEANNAARAALGEVLESQAETEDRIDAIVDGIVCGAAVAGAIGTSVVAGACAGVTGGICGSGGAVAVAGAWSGAASTCASVYADDAAHWILDAPTQAEVQRAYTEYSMLLQANQEAYTLSTKMLSLTSHAADYALETAELLTLQASLDHAVAYQNVVFDSLYDSYLFDPSVQLFEDESLGAMKNLFREKTRVARDLHHAIQYDLGQSLREGTAFSLSGSTYYFPRLAELTVFKQSYADLTYAYEALESVTGDEQGVSEERGFNLVAYASLLEAAHGHFHELYSGRNTTGTVWVGTRTSSLPGIDLDDDGWVEDYDAARDVNPGEWAMLADSVFFDPFGRPSEGCAAGQVDLSDYCSHFENRPAISVPADTCIDVAALPTHLRYDLAHLDHMTHGVGVEPFACWTTFTTECTEIDEHGHCLEGGDVYSPYINVAADTDGDGIFTFAEIGGLRSETYDAGDATFYAAQTPTVRNILDRFLEEVGGHDNILDTDDLEVHPGTFLFLVNLSDGSPRGYTSAAFDPEADILINAPEATDTISEHLAAVALICTDEHTCPDADTPYEAEVFLLGEGYLGSRCLNVDGGRQERVGFDFDPDPILVPAERFMSDLDTNALATMSDAELVGRLGAQPVHGNSMIVSLPAHADFNQNQREVLGEATAWSLYRSADSTLDGPRLRMALRFSYYDATAQTADFDYDVVGLLQCHTPGDAVCVNGSCP